MDRTTFIPIMFATLALAGCGATIQGDHGDASVGRDGASTVDASTCAPTTNVDLLVEIDNSPSMSQNQEQFVGNLDALLRGLFTPPVGPAVTSLHVGVIDMDLGTPGSVVPSCANSDAGDDGLLNPIRNGLAIRTHEPWTTALPGRRPARCLNDPNQFPSFLTFAAGGDATSFREDFVCNAFLSIQGCGLEQQLESIYRAIVVRNPRALPGNMDPNAGFVRDDAVLAMLVLTDEEDGSTRDCRYAEQGHPCTDAISVYDSTSPDWSHNDLNLRFYAYDIGSRQDPTWPLDRYIDPTNPNRGYLSLKPGHPERVVFSAIAGVPIEVPTRASGDVDWDALLGSSPDGHDGLVAMSREGPVSMRQRNLDPLCTTRVVPSCRREGTSYNPMSCAATEQYFAWPSRRIAQVARRFAETRQNGTISSICRNDYREAMTGFAASIGRRLGCR